MSLLSSASVSASSVRTTAPQVFCVTSYATTPSFANGSSGTMLANFPAASHYLTALKQATRHFQVAPLSAVSMVPCSSSTLISLATCSSSTTRHVGYSSTHYAASTAPSSLSGGSVSFPSFIPTNLCCTGNSVYLVGLPCWVRGQSCHPHSLSHYSSVFLGSTSCHAWAFCCPFVAVYRTFMFG